MMILLLLLVITTHGIEMSVGDLVKVYELGENAVGQAYENKDLTHNGYLMKGWVTGDPRTFQGIREHTGLVCEDDLEIIADHYSTYNPEYAGMSAADFDGAIDECWELAKLAGGDKEFCDKTGFNKQICCGYCEEHVGGAEDHICEILDWFAELDCEDEVYAPCTGSNINPTSCAGDLKDECSASCYIHGHNTSGCKVKPDYVKGSTCQRKAKPVPGCTDATAINYNAAATEDDGSCEHKVCTEECKYWMGFYTCDKLTEFGMDCYACECGLTCSSGCKDFLAQHFTCEQLAEKGMDCSACDCTKSCHPTCEQYLDTFTCDQMAEKGLDCSPCNCEPKCFSVCTQYLAQGVSCDGLKDAGYDCSACSQC